MQYQERIQQLRRRLRHAVERAEAADAKWNRLNDTLDQRIEATDASRARSRRPPLTDFAKVQLKNENLELADAFGVQSWWRTQAQYYASAILAEQAAYDILGGAE